MTLRNILILVGVLIVLLGAYFGFTWLNNKNASDISNTIFTADISKVSGIDVVFGDSKLKFTQKSNSLTLTSPTNVAADDDVVKNLQNTIFSLVAEKVVDSNAKDFSKYGLDKPSATVTVRPSSSASSITTIYIGNNDTASGGYYLEMSSKKNIVYLISKQTADNIMLNDENVRSKVLFPYTSDQVNYFSLYKNGKTVFEVKASTDSNGKQWSISNPVSFECDNTKVNDIINAAIALRADQYVYKNGLKLTDCGLNNPQYTFCLGASNSSTMKYNLGSEVVKGKQIYGVRDGTTNIFIMNLDNFSFGNKNVADVISTYVHKCNIDDLYEIRVTNNNITSAFTITSADTDSNNKYTLDNVQIKNNKDFEDFFTTLTKLQANQVDLNKPKSTVSVLNILYSHTAAPGIVKFDFVQRDNTSYYVLKNSQYIGLVISKDALTNITNALTKIQGIVNSYK